MIKVMKADYTLLQGFTVVIRGGSISTNATDWQALRDAYDFNPTIGQDGVYSLRYFLFCFSYHMILMTDL
jgi:hypothetical protein